MRLLFLSMHYRPEPCDTRTSVLAREMARRGHDCTSLTSFPNYPFGKVYDGYRQKLWQWEEIEGVRVLRVPMVPDHSKSVKRRATSYLSFGLSASMLGALLLRRQDLVWVHHPPLTTAFAGWFLSRLKRAPFVLEVHDLWPETFLSSGMLGESWVTRAIRRCCRFLYRRAAAVVVTSPGMKSHLVAQGVEDSRIVVHPQWADEEAFSRCEECAPMPEGFNVVFAGNIGVAQGLDTVLEAASLLQEQKRVRFVFVGAGVELERLQCAARERGLDNVLFVGQVSREEVWSYLNAADALLLHLRNDPLFAITVPSKTQTYLLAGRPVLCGVAGDTADVVRRANAGLAFPPCDAQAMASAIVELHTASAEERYEMGRRARNQYQAEFSVERLVQDYESLFFRLLRTEQRADVESWSKAA